MTKVLQEIICSIIFASENTVVVAQLVRAPDCGSGGHGFEPRLPPQKPRSYAVRLFLFLLFVLDSWFKHCLTAEVFQKSRLFGI